MELKIYKVNHVDDNNFFVFAYSWEHALVLAAELTEMHPQEYMQKDVTEVTREEAKEIIVDYNYVTDSVVKETLFKAYKREAKKAYDERYLKSHAVITDDFVDYTGCTS